MKNLEDFISSTKNQNSNPSNYLNQSKNGYIKPNQSVLNQFNSLKSSKNHLIKFDPFPIKSILPQIFSIGRVQFSLDQPLKFLSSNANILIFLTSPSNPSSSNLPHLIKIDLQNPSIIHSIPLNLHPILSNQSISIIHKIHSDPTSNHLLISLITGQNFYISLNSSSFIQSNPSTQFNLKQTSTSPFKLLSKLNGLVISSIGWNQIKSNLHSKHSTKEIIVGTTSGQLFTTLILDHHHDLNSDLSLTSAFSRIDRSNPDKYLKPLFTLPDSSSNSSPITGIWWNVWYQNSNQNKIIKRALAIITTPNRLYQFVDQVGLIKNKLQDDDQDEILERLFNSYNSNHLMSKSLELPTPDHNSELYVFNPIKSTNSSLDPSTPSIISWLTGAGIYCGEILYGSQQAGDEVIVSSQLITYPSSSQSINNSSSINLHHQNSSETHSTVPISFVPTEFHFVLLYDDRITITCRLDNQVVHEEILDLRPDEHMIAITLDSINQTYWLYSDQSIFELVIKDESRNIWKVYLQRQDFDEALKRVNTPVDRDQVLIAQADHYFNIKKFIPAAQIYAQCSKSFEAVVMNFIDRGERDALRYYLISRLERLKRQELTQRMMLATWLTEIYLAKINELEDLATSETSIDSSANIIAEQSLIEDELQQFLKTYKSNLDQRTTYELITSHGRKDVMIYYANLVADHERIIRHYIQEEDWKKAIDSLSRQDDLELYYRFAPVLVNHDARSATTAFMRQAKLDVKRLIPALIPPRSTARRRQNIPDGDKSKIVIEYLKFSISKLNNSDPQVHNALLTLYATQPQSEEGLLLRFLATTPDNPSTGKPYYDLDYGLRVCKTNNKLQSCGLIYSKMGLYESSVDLALQTDDLELAKINAEKPEDDILLKKKLWLKIAKHVVHHQNDIKTAMEFLESTDLLQIEDILPFFPDFVVIDDFKQEICNALDNYSLHIQKLKQDMEEANQSAEMIKEDLSKLSSRFLIINQKDVCCCCEEKLLTRQFYLFPCQHSFHADCLIKEVTKHMPPHQLRRMLTLQNKLSQPHLVNQESRGNGTSGIWLNGNEGSSLLSDSKKLAIASVQGLDQVRKLIIPDALVGVIGGGVGVIGSGVEALGGVLTIPGVGKTRNRVSSQNPNSIRTYNQQNSSTNSNPSTSLSINQSLPQTTLGKSLRKTVPGKRFLNEMEKLKEELDELLASKCLLCYWSLNSINKGFILDDEVEI
ncbi:hypothetical protein O181_002536 [Austropuccinia psidii MF-1]|uniref:Pep3/Vps18/deep orange domain-containing protein n=1 Tax=Austropuccinia psidii MF-1 TaxID=1389203 RepID=A0A9Q3GDC7_9BASI|nr:hypothetical protein [Austropuccinia psidii MF-1]